MSWTSDNEDEEFFDATDSTPCNNEIASRSRETMHHLKDSPNDKPLAMHDKLDGFVKKLEFDTCYPLKRTDFHYSSEALEMKTKKSVVIHEPDIVQSTKSGSLPRQQLPVPTIPPRKKKVKSAELALPSPSRDIETGEGHDSILINLVEADLHEGEDPRTSRMPECTSPILDLSSATKGSCLISLNDQLAECKYSRQNSSDSSLSAKSEDDNLSGDETRNVESTEASTATSSIPKKDSQMTLTLGISGKKDSGEEGYSFPLSMARLRTTSGSRYMTDKEILEQIYVLNLDTGETVPLSSAEEKIPKCINPLSLHIMRRTKEYSSSDSNLHKADYSDSESLRENTNESKKSKSTTGRRRMKLKKFIGKTVHKIKAVTEKASHGEDTSTDDDEVSENRKAIKVKTSNSHKGPYDFDLLVPVQEIGDNKSGAVWTMKFSHCGRLLATGGQDGVLRVWVVKDAFPFFNELRMKYNDASSSAASKANPAPGTTFAATTTSSSPDEQKDEENDETDLEYAHMPFHKKPFCSYKGHTADVLDISWSKNYFLLSSSMDKTVRLWHVSRRECLCCFQHIDFVTAISFHPKDDRYFLSGSLDGKLRLWNIPDKKVALWNEVVGPTKLITAANFCLDGRFAVVGTYDGRCIFYNSEQLKYFTQIHVRSTRGKNARGRKITGVEPLPGEDKILVTSNDSRVRLYDLRDLTLTCKYKGVLNNSSQIKASFSHDGKYVVCGSEDHFVFIWRTQHEFYKFSSARRDRNDYWEGIKAHSAVVTNAIFAPNPKAIIKPQFEFIDLDDKDSLKAGQGEVLVSADYLGYIRIFINKFKPPPS